MDQEQVIKEGVPKVLHGDLGWSPLTWLLEGETSFIFSMMIGSITILIWSVQRFNEPAFALSKRGSGLELRPSDIFQGMNYVRGWVVFYLLLLFGYFFMVFMGPSFAGLFGMNKATIPGEEVKATFPLLLLAFLINILPNTPKLSEAERYVRAMGQRALGFPQDIGTLRNSLVEARLEMKHLKQYIVRGVRANDQDSGQGFNDKPLSYLTEDDFKEKRVKAISDWRRSCILLWLCRHWHGELLRGQGRMAQVYAILSQELDDLSKDVKSFKESLSARKAKDPAAETARDKRDVSKQIDENTWIDETTRSRMLSLHEEIALLCITLSYRAEQSSSATIRQFEQLGFIFPARAKPLDLKNLAVWLLLSLSIAGVVAWYLWLGVLAIVYGSSDALEIIKNSYKMEVFLSNLKREGVPTLTGNEPPLLIMLAANTAIPIAAASLAAVVVRRWRIESKVWQSEPYDYLVVTIAAAFISLIALVSTDIVIKAVVKPDQYVTQDAPIPTVAFPAKVNPVAPAGQPPADAGNETQMRSPLLGLTGYLPFVLVYALIGFACTVVQGGNVGMPIRRQWRFLLGAATMVAITLLWLDVTSHGSALGARLTPIRNHFSLSNDTLNRLIADITAAYAVVKAMLGAISALVACAVVAYFTRRDVSESSEVDRLVTEVDAAYGEQATENGAQRGQASPRGTSKPDLKEFKEWVLSVNKDISNLSPAEASRFSNRRSDISAAIGAYVRNLTMRDPTARDQVERDQAETKTDNRLEIVLANLKDQPCEAWARQTIQFEGLKTVRIGKGDTEVRFRVATKTPSDDQWKNDSLNVAGSEEVEVEWRTSDKPDTTTTAKLAIDDICGIFMAKTSSSVEPPSHPQEPPPVHPQQPPEREVVVAEIQPNIKEAANLMRAGEGRRP